MAFPCLTGLQSRTRTGEPRSTTIDSRVAHAHLLNTTASIDALPISALQAGWAVILSNYVGVREHVTFATAHTVTPSTRCESESVSNDGYRVVQTQAFLNGPKSSIPVTNGEFLKWLTELHNSAVGQKEETLYPSSGQSQTLVAFYGTERSEEGKSSNNQPPVGKDIALSIAAWPYTTGFLKLQATYTDTVLDEPSALVVLAQLDDILGFILADLTKPVRASVAAIRLSLLSVTDSDVDTSKQLLTDTPYLHTQFEVTAQNSPNHVALEFRHDICTKRSTTWTYGELNHRANIFAKFLVHTFGHLSDKVIPICMDRCPELYVAVLGILKSGGAWCPIDCSFPARRRHALIARTGSNMLVVADLNLAGETEGIPAGVAVVDITMVHDVGLSQIELSDVGIGSLAYLIWTSGTTGDPKGVPIHHEAAITSMKALQKSIPTEVTGDNVRCLQFSHFTFDVFVQDLFYTWGVRGTIISSTREFMLGSFAELSNSTNATHAHLTPAFAASVPREQCKTLEVVTMIGENLPQAVADDWSTLRAYNTYGPAETAVVSTFRRFGALGDELQSENIGHPLPSVSAFVMRDGLPLLTHGVGELALGGPQLSTGYWNDPDKTAERFVWNGHLSRRLYLTGDMVRQLHDGSLEFIGREDDLIKIQGVRVELSEVSFALRSCHASVEQVETLYLDRIDRPSKVIVAFLAAPKLVNHHQILIPFAKAAPIAKIALLQAQKNLPMYMIPRVILVVNKMPQTSSNKIDKAALKAIYGSSDLGSWEKALTRDDGDISGAENWSQDEGNIVSVVAELSGTAQNSMSRLSELRSVGIDSIAATRLAPMLSSKGYSVSVADVLRCQRLGDIFEISQKSGQSAKRFDLDAFNNEWHSRVAKRIKDQGFVAAPVLPLQESLLAESMQNDARAYWSNIVLSLDAQVDTTLLQKAWTDVVNGTEALRTGFIPSAAVSDDGSDRDHTFIQLIYDKADLDWTNISAPAGKLKDLATERASALAEKHQKDAFRKPPVAVTIFEQMTGSISGCDRIQANYSELSRNNVKAIGVPTNGHPRTKDMIAGANNDPQVYHQPLERTMMISVHHSIRDEMSLDFILDDVRKSYTREIPNHRHQFREALRLMLPSQEEIDEDRNFWSKTLGDFVTTDDTNEWPDLTGSHDGQGEGFITHSQSLTSSYAELQDVALSLGATSAASILRVAWGSILLMYLEAEGVVFAETWSNRIDNPTLANVVGPLTTVLPIPFRAIGSAREALNAQSLIQKFSTTHRSIPGSIIRKLLNRPRHQSLYPALFNFLPDSSEPDLSTLWTKTDSIIGLTVEHPLALNVTPKADGVVELELLANPNAISRAHLAILASQVNAFVQVMLHFPDIPLTQIPSRFCKDLLSMSSVHFSREVQSAFMQNPTAWVDHYAALRPHWPAAQFFNSIEEKESESWNFADLQFAYKRVADFVRHHGHYHKMIAVCLDRRLEAYAVILGIMASGNIYLPIDEDLPEERKTFLLQDSQAAMLFTTTNLASAFSRNKIPVVNVDHSCDMERTSNGHLDEAVEAPQPNDNAYLLYTSGSTGVPKGVLVGRGNLCSFIEGLSEYVIPRIPKMTDLPGKGKYLGLASRAFDVHLAEMFLAWRMGLAIVTAPRTLLLDNLELALRKFNITHASFVPSLIEQASLNPQNLPNLRYLGVGGEKMSKRVANTWAASGSAALVNAYGPTEMSIGCTAVEVTPGSNLRNIGRPYGNSIAHVLVPGSNEYTLKGVAGELCFTGCLVANGYHSRPDAKGFVDDFNGERMYRTGDIVRLMADDTLEYMRREDDQTKLRGQRLELGEISEAIRSSVAATLGLDKVEVATLIVQHPKLPRPQLVSFIVPRRQPQKRAEGLGMLQTFEDFEIAGNIQEHCQKILPAYMVPDIVLPLTKLPLAPSSGKADSKRLKALFMSLSIEDIINPSGGPSSSPRDLSKAEEAVHGAVTATLAIDSAKIAFNTNLFRLGLDSLGAITMTIKMQQLGYDCAISDVLKSPSLEQLALLPRRKSPKVKEAASEIVKLESRFRTAGRLCHGFQGVKPCLPLQETLVAASLNDQSRALYVNNVTLKLSAGVDVTQLYRAWTMVVADHDILRTCFQDFENGFVQVIREFDESQVVFWEEIATPDPNFITRNTQNKPSIRIITEMSEKPPLRLYWIRSPSAEQNPLLLFQIHHALYDRESFSMILEELERRYRGIDVMLHSPFDSLLEYVCAQSTSEGFWKQYLENYYPTATIDRASIDEALTLDGVLSSSLTELEHLSISADGTLNSTIQAIFGIILARTLGTHDVVFGAVLSGRTVPIENSHTIIAPCITTIPQRIRLGTEFSTVTDIIKAAQHGFAESLTYQHTALRHIHRWIEAEKPLFDCLVTYIQKRSKAPSDLWTELEGSMINDFPLAVEFEADYETDRMRIHCAFTPAFGSIDEAASLLENIDLLLGALVRGENVTTQDLGISEAATSKARPQIWDESRWSSVESRMQDFVAEICSISAKDISKGASFFSMGIDSVTGIRFAQRLRQSGIECSSADVMRHTCIAALAQHIAAADSASKATSVQQDASLYDSVPEIPTLSPGDVVTDIYKCTPLQASMLTQTLGSNGKLYTHHHAVRLSGTADRYRLKEAWESLVLKTEILRTTFHFVESTSSWIAAVHRETMNAWTERGDGRSTSQRNDDMKSFNFGDEASFERPPWETTVLKGTEEVIFVVSMHHCLYDGISIHLLFEDLARAYHGVELPSRPTFSDAARMVSNSTTDAEQFWLQKLKGFEGSKISQAVTANRIGIEHTLKMDMQSIVDACKLLNVTVQTVALLAFAKSLACLSERRDVVFGHVVGGRSLAIPGADEVIGPLFNTIPARVRLEKTRTTSESKVHEIQKFTGDSQAHQHASLSRIQQVWQQKTDSDAQLLDAIFVFQNYMDPLDSPANDLWAPIDIENTTDPTEYSMNLEVEQGKDRILFRANARMAPEKLQNWLGDFEQIFRDILEHPSRSVLAFPASLQRLPMSIKKVRTLTSEDAIEPGPDLDAIRTALLKVSQISAENIPIGASIFSLGLDSIAAIQLAAICRMQGYAISVADVLQGRSLGGICKRFREKRSKLREIDGGKEDSLVSAQSKSKALALVNVTEQDAEHVLPCLAGQLYHLISWLKSDRTASEAVFAYQCFKHLEVDSLRLAWTSLRERHSILRTLLVAVSPTEVVQVVLTPSALNDDSFECVDSQYELNDNIEQQTKQPFDLFSPPSKLCLIRDGSQNYILLILHHALYDAWTVQRIVNDLAGLYGGNQLPSPIRFESFVSHTVRSLHNEPEKLYWRKALSKSQRTLLKPLTAQPPPARSISIFINFRSAITNLHSVEATCRTSSTSISILILLAFARTLARYTTVTQPVFGLYQIGRSASFEGIGNLCGPCLNVTPLCVPDVLEASALQSTQRLQADLAQRVPFEQSYLHDILRYVGIEGKPLFNAFVNILPGPPPAPEFAAALFTPYQQTKDSSTELATHEAISTTKGDMGNTAVDALDTAYLADENLYLDVVRKDDEGCLDFAARCDRRLMDEDEVRAFMEQVAREVQACADRIGQQALEAKASQSMRNNSRQQTMVRELNS